MRLHRIDVLGKHRLLDFRDQALVGEVDAFDLDLGRLLVEEVVQLLLGELRDRLVHVEAGTAEDTAVPPVHAVAGDRQGTPAERLAVIVERREIEIGDRAHALAPRAHAAQVDRVLHHALLDPAAFLGAHHPACLPRRDVEGECRGRPDMRCPQPAEQDAQHRVGVRGGAHGGAGVGTHPFLVHDNSGGQAFQQVDVRPRQCRHEALHERAVRLVDHPLRLRGNRGEHQGAFARTGDARKYRQPALRDLQADIFEVVLPRALHADQVVAVGHVRGRRLGVGLGGHAHRVSLGYAGQPPRLPSASPDPI
ncbi:hypothetical protein D9M72_363850 [compost metagenome]